MAEKTISEIEKDLADTRAKAIELEQALEAKKQEEIEKLRAKRVKGILTAWDKLTAELVKADLVNAPDHDNITTERGQKMAETKFNKRSLEVLGEVLGLATPAATGESGATEGRKKSKTLTPDDEKKIIDELKAGKSVNALAKAYGVSNPVITRIRDTNKIPAKKVGKAA